MQEKEKNTKVYLTKRALISATKKGMREAAKETISVMGYNVVSEDGWIVKKYPDGRIERIKQMEEVKRPAKLILD